MSRKKFWMSELVCTRCGRSMDIPRTRQREYGHIKTMYCYGCGEDSDFIENHDKLFWRYDYGEFSEEQVLH
jgi:lysyl-tRNA synthetase class I